MYVLWSTTRGGEVMSGDVAKTISQLVLVCRHTKHVLYCIKKHVLKAMQIHIEVGMTYTLWPSN